MHLGALIVVLEVPQCVRLASRASLYVFFSTFVKMEQHWNSIKTQGPHMSLRTRINARRPLEQISTRADEASFLVAKIISPIRPFPPAPAAWHPPGQPPAANLQSYTPPLLHLQALPALYGRQVPLLPCCTYPFLLTSSLTSFRHIARSLLLPTFVRRPTRQQSQIPVARLVLV